MLRLDDEEAAIRAEAVWRVPAKREAEIADGSVLLEERCHGERVRHPHTNVRTWHERQGAQACAQHAVC